MIRNFSYSIAFLSSAIPVMAKDINALETVKAMYAADAPFLVGKGEGIMGSAKLRQLYFSKQLNAEIDTDRRNAKKRGEPPALESDPLVDAQEPGAKNFRATAISETAGAAKVEMRFDQGGGQEKVLTLSLVLEASQWRLDDIFYGRVDGVDYTLHSILKAQ